MTIGRKLLLSFGVLAAIVLGFGGTGLYSIHRQGAELKDYSIGTVPKILLFGSFNSQFMAARYALRSCM